MQKTHNDGVPADMCFAADSNCYAVQTSYYAKTFGIPNPYYGLVAFSLGIIIFIILLYNSYIPFIKKGWYKHIITFILFGLTIGAAFSIWMLYAQFVLIRATCKYCLWVDGIMIGMTILFTIFRKKI